MNTLPVETPPKTRSDCVIDAELGPEAANALFERLGHGLSLKEAVRVLQQEHAVTVSPSAVSRWAAKRRQEKSALVFAALRERFNANFAEALEVGEDEEEVQVIHRANIMMAAQALFAAQASGDGAAVAQAARAFGAVVSAVAKSEQIRNVYDRV